MKKLIIATTLLLVGVIYSIPSPNLTNIWVFDTETNETVLNNWTAPWWAFYNQKDLLNLFDQDELLEALQEHLKDYSIQELFDLFGDPEPLINELLRHKLCQLISEPIILKHAFVG
jgi:hypothetical protein